MMELEGGQKRWGSLSSITLAWTGIDHLYAVKTIEEVYNAGGKIRSFTSYCGGLPVPEASDNPLGYKLFSRRPTDTAQFWQVVREWKSRGHQGRRSHGHRQAISHLLALPALHTPIETPAFSENDTSSQRHRKWSAARFAAKDFQFIRVLVDIGFLSEDTHDFLKPSDKPLSWATATQKVLSASSKNDSDLVWAIASKTKVADTAEKERSLSDLKWISPFSSDPITPRNTPLDTLCVTLESKMQYDAGEQDTFILQHKFGIEHKDGRVETRTSTLCDSGDPKSYSSMAGLVGVPCGVACLMVLDGRIKEKGILAPANWQLAEPLLIELKEKWGIEMIEKTIQ